MGDVVTLRCTDYARTVREAFEQAGGPAALAGFGRILLKPNLVNTSPFPVTTHPEFTGAVVDAVRAHTDAPVVIAEGTGDKDKETAEVFAALGYDDLAREKDVELLDLNHADLVEVSRPDCPVFPTMWLPEIAFTHCIVSLPVLKGHSMAGVTGTMKNMMGFAPPSHYQGGGWKKALFHQEMHGSIRDLNRYVTPHFTVMDATVGLKDYHLGGPPVPPGSGHDPGRGRSPGRGPGRGRAARHRLARRRPPALIRAHIPLGETDTRQVLCDHARRQPVHPGTARPGRGHGKTRNRHPVRRGRRLSGRRRP